MSQPTITNPGFASSNSCAANISRLPPAFSPLPNCVGAVASILAYLYGVSNAVVNTFLKEFPIATGLQSINSSGASSDNSRLFRAIRLVAIQET